jgi:hypothetical protein
MIRLHIEEVYSLSYNVEEHIELLNGNNHRGERIDGGESKGTTHRDYSRGGAFSIGRGLINGTKCMD